MKIKAKTHDDGILSIYVDGVAVLSIVAAKFKGEIEANVHPLSLFEVSELKQTNNELRARVKELKQSDQLRVHLSRAMEIADALWSSGTAINASPVWGQAKRDYDALEREINK